MTQSNMKWKEIKDTLQNCPKSRHGHRCIAYGKYMIVIGGGNEGILGDVNIFNTENNKWFSPGCTATIYLGIAAFGMVIKENEIIIFGGIYEDGSYSNDVFQLSLYDWSLQACSIELETGTEIPTPRLGHSFNISSNNSIYMFGGLTTSLNDDQTSVPSYLNDLYILTPIQFNKMKWTKINCEGTPPAPRESHSGAIYFYQGRETLIIYGGMCGKRLGDINFFDIQTQTWSQPLVLGSQPPPRSLHSVGICNNKMIIFGGWIPSNENKETSENIYNETDWQCTNNVSVLNLDLLAWETPIISDCIENVPRPRAGHSGVIINDRFYIWSGRDGFRKSWNDQICCKDLWYLETGNADPPSRLIMDGNDTNSVNVKWDPVKNADFYLIQIMKIGANTICNSQDAKSIIERNINNQKKEQTPQKVTKPPSLPALKLVSPLRVDDSKKLPKFVKSNQFDFKLPDPETEITDNWFNQTFKGEGDSQSNDFNFSKFDSFDKSFEKSFVFDDISMSDFKLDNFLTKNDILPDLNQTRALPPLGVSLPVSKPRDINLHQPYQSKIIATFNDVPTGRWYESVIVSDPKVNVTQFYVEIGTDRSNISRSYINRRSIPLESNYTYRLRVASVNACGIGEFGPPMSFSTTAPGLPGPPTNVKVLKEGDELKLSWSASGVDENLEFSVYISTPLTPTTKIPLNIKSLKFIYEKIYQGKECKCLLNSFIAQDFELGPHERPYLMLRIVAKNLKGYGPVTQIKWYKDELINQGENPFLQERQFLVLKRLKA